MRKLQQTDSELQNYIAHGYQTKESDKTKDWPAHTYTIAGTDPHITSGDGTYDAPEGYKYTGFPPRTKRVNGRPDIRKIHYYHMEFVDGGALSVRQYRLRKDSVIDVADLKSELAELYAKAKAREEPHAFGWTKMQWDEECYICFVMDEDAWDFHYLKDDPKQNDSLHFSDKQGASPNNTFFNADEVTIEHPQSGKTRKVLFCENHLLSPVSGEPRPLNHPPDIYKFDIFFRVSQHPKVFNEDGAEERVTFIEDPGGENTGPPSSGND